MPGYLDFYACKIASGYDILIFEEMLRVNLELYRFSPVIMQPNPSLYQTTKNRKKHMKNLRSNARPNVNTTTL